YPPSNVLSATFYLHTSRSALVRPTDEATRSPPLTRQFGVLRPAPGDPRPHVRSRRAARSPRPRRPQEGRVRAKPVARRDPRPLSSPRGAGGAGGGPTTRSSCKSSSRCATDRGGRYG